MQSSGLNTALRYLHHTVLFLTVWVVFLNGCSSWRILDRPISNEDPREVLVTLKDKSQIKISAPSMKGNLSFSDSNTGIMARADSTFGNAPAPGVAPADTLFGYESENGDRIRIPVEDISFIEARHTSIGKTAGLIVLGFVGFIGAMWLCYGQCYD